jgi:hypothetical protein
MATIAELQARLAAAEPRERPDYPGNQIAASVPRVGHVLAQVASTYVDTAFAPLRLSVQLTFENTTRRILDNAWRNAWTSKR